MERMAPVSIAAALAAGMLLVVGVLAVLSRSPATEGESALQIFDVGAVVAVGALVAVRRPANAVGRILLAGGLLAALLLGLSAYAHYALVVAPTARAGIWALIGEQIVWPPVLLLLFGLLPLVFPDGRFLSRPWRLLAVGLAVICLVPMVGAPLEPELQLPLGSGTVRNPIGFADTAVAPAVRLTWSLLFSVGILAAFGSLALRYRSADGEGRRRIRWVAAAVGLTIVVVALQLVGPHVVPSLVLPDWVFLIPLATIPVAIGVAVLRHRLFDIDLVIRRSLVYGVLWLSIVVVYGGLAAALGLAAGQRLSVQAAVLVTIIATLLFQPARSRLERLADRMAYGQRSGAYEMLRDFGARTERTLDFAEIGPRLANAARAGMGARWAQVLVNRGPWREEVVLASSGEVNGQPALAAPLIRGEEVVGRIECGPRTAGAFNERDGEILAALGRQAALAIQNAALTSELAGRLEMMDEQARELTASRARIVDAQESERQRIERDLHDGVQQQLISLVAGIRLARNRLGRDKEGADDLLKGVQDQALQAAKGLRELVRNILPPVLADAGLVRAVEATVARLPLRVTVDADDVARERPPQALESAAYFVICEALANVMKHSDASEACVRIRQSNDSLLVSVADRGRGFATRDIQASGLTGLQDRVATVGGSLEVRSEPGAGTTITAILPLTHGA